MPAPVLDRPVLEPFFKKIPPQKWQQNFHTRHSNPSVLHHHGETSLPLPLAKGLEMQLGGGGVGAKEDTHSLNFQGFLAILVGTMGRSKQAEDGITTLGSVKKREEPL